MEFSELKKSLIAVRTGESVQNFYFRSSLIHTVNAFRVKESVQLDIYR